MHRRTRKRSNWRPMQVHHCASFFSVLRPIPANDHRLSTKNLMQSSWRKLKKLRRAHDRIGFFHSLVGNVNGVSSLCIALFGELLRDFRVDHLRNRKSKRVDPSTILQWDCAWNSSSFSWQRDITAGDI